MGLDILNPLDGLMGRILHGPMHRFTYARECDYSGYEVESILRQYGIRVWGREFDDAEEISILVRRSQAVWAEYILCRAGIPLTCALLEPKNDQYRTHHPYGAMPEAWDSKGIGAHSVVDHVVDWLNRFLP